MAYQSGRQIEVAYAVETTYGTLPDATPAKVFRPNAGNLSLGIEPIRSNENRRDGMMTRGRHGTRSVTGQYSGDLSVGSYDDLIEAVLRGTSTRPLRSTRARPSFPAPRSRWPPTVSLHQADRGLQRACALAMSFA
jgi:hypothetical protein